MDYWTEQEMMWDGWLVERFPIIDTIEKGLVDDEGFYYAHLHLTNGEVVVVSQESYGEPTELDNLYNAASGHGPNTQLGERLDSLCEV